MGWAGVCQFARLDGWCGWSVCVFAARSSTVRPRERENTKTAAMSSRLPWSTRFLRESQSASQPTRQPANQSTRCPLALLWLAPPPWGLELANHRQPVGSVTPADDMEPAQRGKVSANLAAILHPCPPQPAALSPTETLTPNNRPETKLETRWLLANPWRAPDAVTRGAETAPFPLRAPHART